jgi:hypothetical protein
MQKGVVGEKGDFPPTTSTRRSFGFAGAAQPRGQVRKYWRPRDGGSFRDVCQGHTPGDHWMQNRQLHHVRLNPPGRTGNNAIAEMTARRALKFDIAFQDLPLFTITTPTNRPRARNAGSISSDAYSPALGVMADRTPRATCRGTESVAVGAQCSSAGRASCCRHSRQTTGCS